MKKILLPGILAIAATINTPQTHAQSATWSGNAMPGSNAWSNASNWTGTPGSGGTLTFPGTASSAGTINNDLASATAFALTFTGSLVYTLEGNSITLNGSLAGSSTATQTIRLNLILNAGRSIGTTGVGSHLNLEGNISGAFNVNYNNAGTKLITGQNTNSGNATISGGAVTINSIGDAGIASSLGSGSFVRVGSAGAAGTLIYSSTSAASSNKTFAIGGGATAGNGTIMNNSTSSAHSLTLAGGISSDHTLAGGNSLFLGGSNTGNNTVSGVIANSTGSGTPAISLVKQGAGKWIVTGSNTYSGGTTISAGTLLVSNSDGSGTGSGDVVVASGAILGGDGTIAGATNIAGILAPGNSIGTLEIANNTTWNGSAGNSWQFELGAGAVSLAAANAATDSDLLNITGSFNQSGSIWEFDFRNSGSAGWFKLVDWTGSTAFDTSDFTYANLGGGLTGTFTLDNSTSALYFNAVPEPSTGALIAGGLTLILVYRRRCA